MPKFLLKSMSQLFFVALMVTACNDDSSRIAGPELKPQFATVDATDVSTGTDFTCAIRAGAVQCQGRNEEGQAPAAKSAGTGFFTQIAAGTWHACALRNDGVAECWGNNSFFQAPATQSATTGYFTAITAGNDYTCGLRNDGVIECWGNNTLGQAEPTFTATSGTFTQVSAKVLHTCARRSDGVIQCWGKNNAGQAPTTKTAATGTFVQVSTGNNFSCGLRADGKVECWGDPFHGQAPALRTAAIGSYTRVTSSDMHSCAIRTDGKIECWGENNYGEAPPLISPPVGVAFTSFSVSNYHSCGTWSQGVLQCLGRFDYGAATSDIPAIQSMIRVTPTNGPIQVSYTNASDETEFQIERRIRFADKSYGEWLRVKNLNANFTFYHDYLVNEGSYYQYRVRACDEWATCTPWLRSDLVRASLFTVPVAPTSLTISHVNAAQINLAWGQTDRESSFNLQRRDRTYSGTGAWTLIAIPPADAEGYEDRAVTTGRAYTYRVQACNSRGCSAWVQSSEIINETVPQVPTAMTATPLSSSLIELSWSDNSTNEASFSIYRRTLVGGVWSDYAWLADAAENYNTHDDHTVSAGTTYRYRVRACNLAGCSDYATGRGVTTP